MKTEPDIVVVFFDIKNFKAVNELFGTEIGDMMLRKVYEDVRKSGAEALVSGNVRTQIILSVW